MGVIPSLSRIVWKPSWRILPSRFPPISSFERVTEPADLEAVLELEAVMNPSVASVDQVSGDIGSGVIMSPFAHPNPNGSRFSNGTYGVYYATQELPTAIAETRYHRARFMCATQQPPMELDMRVYQVDLEGELHDLRNQLAAQPLIFHPHNYAAAQSLAISLHSRGSNGIAYDSARMAAGECAAVFRPSLLSNVRHVRNLCYVWDGAQIAKIYEKLEIEQDELA